MPIRLFHSNQYSQISLFLNGVFKYKFAYLIYSYYICKTDQQTQIYKMDIVSRLKTFISHLNIQVTQFADNCTIPRPTLSQLLNGRNKKVSDELIGKIHEAYPELSVLWLMFGEGDMLHTKNIEVSEPKPGGIFDFQNDEEAINVHITPNIDFKNNSTENYPENSTEHFSSSISNIQPQNCVDHINIKLGQHHNTEPSNEPIPTINFQANQSKRVVNIIVYYSDNSFESFIPSSSINK